MNWHWLRRILVRVDGWFHEAPERMDEPLLSTYSGSALDYLKSGLSLDELLKRKPLPRSTRRRLLPSTLKLEDGKSIRFQKPTKPRKNQKRRKSR